MSDELPTIKGLEHLKFFVTDSQGYAISAHQHPDAADKFMSVAYRDDLVRRTGDWPRTAAPEEMHEVKAGHTRDGTEWRIGFFRSRERAEQRILEEIANDAVFRLKFRRYYIVTHAFRD